MSSTCIHIYNNCGNLSKKECKEVVSILFRSGRDEWLAQLRRFRTNLRTYQLFKQEYGPEPYTNILISRAHRSLLTKPRGGSSPDRDCEICGCTYIWIREHASYFIQQYVGDEAHFMLACSVLHLDRLPLFTYMSHTVSSFEHLSVAEQCVQ